MARSLSWLEHVTDDPIPQGVIEKFPFWPVLRKQTTFSGLERYDETKPDPLNYLTYTSL